MIRYFSEAKEAKLSEPAHFVSARVCRDVLDWRAAIDRLRTAYSSRIPAEASPSRVIARGDGRSLRTLTAAPPTSRMMGAKVFGVGPSRRTNYAIILIEQESGEIKAVVDGGVITAVRTSATSALAVDHLAPGEPVRLALLGSSLEAWSHLQAISAIREISEAWVYSPSPVNRDAFAAKARETLSIACRASESASSAVQNANLVVAAARSSDESPILYGEWLLTDAVVVSVGSTVPQQREIDVSVVQVCDLIVCDAVEEVVNETGDMIAATAAGADFESKIISLNQLLSNPASGRGTARRPLYKSVGNGVQDIVIAELALESALAAGRTLPLPVGFHQKS